MLTMLFQIFKLFAYLCLSTAALTILFKLAVKLRLALPFLYLGFLSLSTIVSDFAYTSKALYILIALLSLSVISWIITLIQFIHRKKEERFWKEDMLWQIQNAKERGLPLTSILFDEDHNLLDSRTGKPVDWC